VISGHWGRESIRDCSFVNNSYASIVAFGTYVVASPDAGKDIEIDNCRYENLHGAVLGDNFDVAQGIVSISNSRIVQNQTLQGNVTLIDDIRNTRITVRAVDFCCPGTTSPFRFFHSDSGFVIEDCRFRLNLSTDYQGSLVYTANDDAGRSLSFRRNVVDVGSYLIGALFWLDAATQVAIGEIEGNAYSDKAARGWFYMAGGGGPATPELLQAAGHDLNGIFTGADASGACA